MLGSLILYLKGMRIMMFQLSGFYCRVSEREGAQSETLNTAGVWATLKPTLPFLPWQSNLRTTNDPASRAGISQNPTT